MDKFTKLDIIGKEVKSVTIFEDEVVIITNNNKKYRMYHDQDCCEYVRVTSSDNLSGLIGSVINNYEHEEVNVEDHYDSATITKFIFQTNTGNYEIEWLGESNGYYSESVYFSEVK